MFLANAKVKEKRYDWLGAAELYGKALFQFLEIRNFSKAGEIQEEIGFCFHIAAMQTDSQKSFMKEMHRAIKAYEEAHGFYEKSPRENGARMLRCEAITRYLRYWIILDPSEKKKLLDECLELMGKALTGFSESRETLEYGKTYSCLPLLFFWRNVLEWNGKTLKSIVEKGLEWGEKAVKSLSEVNDLYETAKAYLTFATCLVFLEGFIKKPEEKEVNRLKIINYLSRAVDVAESVGDARLLGFLHLFLGANTSEEESVEHFEKLLECGVQTKSNFLLASGYDLLAYMTYWKALSSEDPDERIKLADEAMKSYDLARHHLSRIACVNPRGVFMRLRARARAPPASRAEHFVQVARWETSQEERKKLLEKAVWASTKALKRAERSTMPYAILYILHVASVALEARARIDPDALHRRTRLNEALKHRKRAIEILEELAPFDYYAQGVMQNYLAGLKAELSDTELNSDQKRSLLEEAVSSNEKSLDLCNKMIPYFEQMGDVKFLATLQPYQDAYATMLIRLYGLTGNVEYVSKAIYIQQAVIESATKLGMVSLLGESYWKVAKAHDIIGDHLEAAENFESASASYNKAAEKIPQLKDFFQDHAFYMQAWSEIEKAKYNHSEKEYGQAKKHYDQAATLHKSTKRWNYLNANYLAWARLEEAEDVSRAEHPKKASQLFQKAARLFRGSKKTLKATLTTIENTNEKDLAVRLIKASDIRAEYCLGRIALEEAKILSRKGDNAGSSEKFAVATRRFQNAMNRIEQEPVFTKATVAKDKQELMPIIYLCKAWQMMTKAEAEASPELYLKASQFFTKVKEYSPNERAKLLALGHSRFCRALEAGTRFEDSRDMNLYFSATKHLESAANYYVKAGFIMASEYALATQRLFDAYVYMANAKRETDPEKMARYYIVAERVLQTSIGSYLKAKHPAKSEQVKRLLEKVREERELVATLSEVLHAPNITSSTTSFGLPTPSEETAVGLERFEHASIQVNLILPTKKIAVEEDFRVEMQIANVGKEAVLLDKIEGVFSSGLELVGKPRYYSIESKQLNMKGKRLDPLKTEEIRLVLRSFSKGSFKIKPKIIYVDNAGIQLASEVEEKVIEVSKIVLANRITTGHEGLDNLLFGGIPKNYAVMLTSPACDERDFLIRRFLKTGAQEGQITFYLTSRAYGVASFSEEFQSNFYLFICNPQADAIVKNSSNVFKFKGVENLTDINISLTSALHKLDAPAGAIRKCCIEIVSDVLLQHQALQTRRWLAGLLPELKAEGFTILALMDLRMHSIQEVRAVLDLFDGEINIYKEKNTLFLKIMRMAKQEYLESELRIR